MKNNQRKTKIAVFAFFAVASFLIAGSKFSSAQQDPPKKAASGMVVANMNIRDAKIEKQENTVLTISFNISNDFDKVQPGILLRASLAKNENNLLSVVDEKIIGSEFTLEAKEKSHREIVYAIPDFMQGKYEIWINAQTAGGLPLSTARVGETTFSGTNEYVEIVNNSCFLKVKGESEDKKYTLLQGVDIEKTENLQAVCDLMNHSDQPRKFSAEFQTFQRNTFGTLLETSQKNDASFALQAKEKKQFIFDLPKANEPQAYDIKLTLQENKKTISNSAVFHYVLRGASATIQSLQLDKVSYQKDETAKASLMVTGSADNFPDSRHGAGTDLKATFLSVKIQSGKILCGQIQKPPQLSGMPDSIEIAMAENCPEPTASVILKDSAGNILAQKDFFVGKNSQAEMQKATQIQVNEKNKKSFTTFLIIVIALLAISLAVYVLWKLKKKSSVIVPILFLGLGLAISFHMARPAKALTLGYFPEDPAAYTPYAEGYIFDSFYHPGDPIIASGFASLRPWGCANRSDVPRILNVEINGITYPLTSESTPLASSTFSSTTTAMGTAPYWPGDYAVTFTLKAFITGDEADISGTIPYTVVAPPQNGACGFANNTAGCGPPPLFYGSLCSAGPPSGVSDYGYWSWSCGGAGGGANASCWAGKTVINASCGWALGDITNPFQPTDGFCDQGQLAGGVSDNGTNWSWTCGSNCNGASALCTKAKPPIEGACNYNTQSFKPSDFPSGSLCSSGIQEGGNFNNISGHWEWNCGGANGGGSQFGCWAKKTVDGACNYNTQSFCPNDNTFPSGSLCSSGIQEGGNLNNISGHWEWNCGGANGGTSQLGCWASKTALAGLQCGNSVGPFCGQSEITSQCNVGTASGITDNADKTGWTWNCSDSCYGNSITCPASTYSKVGTRTIPSVCQGSDIPNDVASLCVNSTGVHIDEENNDYAKWTCTDICGRTKQATYTKKAPIDGQCGTADGESLCNGLGSLTLCKKGTASPNPPTLDGYDASWQCKDSNNCGGQTASCSARGKKSCGWIEANP